MQLQDKIIAVTGAGNGLGAATACACAKAGARLWLIDRDAAGLAATAAQISAIGGESGSTVGDLSLRRTCFDVIAGAIAHFGRLDGLCNAAGITMFHHTCDVTEAEWQKTLAIILSAPFYLSQAAIPELIRNNGSIVNVASSGGLKGTAYTIPYSSAKAGLIHMTKCMAMEFINETIRINAIAPGGMITNIMKDSTFPENLDHSLIARYAGIRPPAEPTEVANMIVYMLSDGSPYLHGSIISVDGGVSAD